MVNKQVTTYLNDHLSGAVGALDLLDDLEHALAGTPTADMLAGLRADIADDRQELEDLMRRLQIDQSRPRQAAAWLAGKATQLKLRIDDPADGTLRLLEGLEALALGITGKQALWRSLAAASEEVPELQTVDYERLTQRGADQHRRAETMRLAAARAALGPPAG